MFVSEETPLNAVKSQSLIVLIGLARLSTLLRVIALFLILQLPYFFRTWLLSSALTISKDSGDRLM